MCPTTLRYPYLHPLQHYFVFDLVHVLYNTTSPLTVRGGGRGDGWYTTKNTRILFNKLFLFTTALPRDPHVKTKTVFPRDDIVWHSHALFIYKYIAYCKVCTTSPLTAYSPSRVVATQWICISLFCREVVSNQKPRSERRGWETSSKPTLLLRAEGAIRAFFDGQPPRNKYIY